MYKGIQGKFGDMMKGMGMSGMTIDKAKQNPAYQNNPEFKSEVDKADAFTNGLKSTPAGTPDLKKALEKMKPTSPDDAMKMLGDLKRLAGLSK
jgi:hypothetical protein